MSKKKIIGGSTQSTRLSDSNGPNLNKIQNWIDKASRLNQLKLRQFQEGDNPQQKNEENDLFEIQAFSEEEEAKHKSKPKKIKQLNEKKGKGKWDG
ncbi:hypothetical protein FGO68_gene6107 [Halteria grandinella]|uniref:Uncharacterized protein n=1 Tax=Halteria grandinella TaxID=5974 RepID=A0A8J8NF19_HALGN|nr:hypothetical protein FGO68_gene6107 [Halteria grandinella]